MPRSDSAAPRNMLPPPTTTASWTPAQTTSAIASAMCATTRASMPSDSLPANASPETVSRTRRQRGGNGTGEAGHRASSVTVAASPFVEFPVCQSGLADLVAREPTNLDLLTQRRAGLVEEPANGLLGVLDERLLEQGELLVVAGDPALHDLRDRLLRLALLARDLLVDRPLRLQDLRRHLILVHVERVHGGDVL